jgi:hypothetical protein
MRPDELAGILRGAGLGDWCSRVRLGGLLLMLDYAVRNRSSKGFLISSTLARAFTSRLRRQVVSTTIREPLSLLCHIGILRVVRDAIHGPHLKVAARYAFCDLYAQRHMSRTSSVRIIATCKQLQHYTARAIM